MIERNKPFYWAKKGWGQDYSPEFSDSKKFHLDLSEMYNSKKTSLEAGIDAVNQVVSYFPKPFYLMVSGGVDSQSMLWIWKQSGIPFIPVSFEYTHNETVLNDHDLEHLRQFTKIHSIEVQYRKFDIINFLENKLLEYAVKYQCTSPQITTHMALADSIIGGTVVFSGNFGTDIAYNYTILGLMRYAESRSTVPYFLSLTPEIAGSTYDGRIFNRMRNSYQLKVNNLISNGIPVVPQPTKQTGFEKIKDLYDLQSTRVTPIDRLRFKHKPSKRVFDILFRYRLEKYVKYQDIVIYPHLDIGYEQ